MTTLLELQSCFSRSVMTNSADIEPWLAESETPALAIYNNAYSIRLQETLMNDYPALAQLLGDDGFTSLASEYNSIYPSESYSLRYYGQYLSVFLSSIAVYKLQPYLAELAAFEWTLTDIFDQADTPIINIEIMNSIPPEAWPTLKVKLHSTIRWLNLYWNIADIYPSLKTNAPQPELIRKTQQIHYLIWRENNSPHYRILHEREWLAIKTIEKNNFSELCVVLSDLSDTPEKVPLEAATFLKSWMTAGLIESVNYLD